MVVTPYFFNPEGKLYGDCMFANRFQCIIGAIRIDSSTALLFISFLNVALSSKVDSVLLCYLLHGNFCR